MNRYLLETDQNQYYTEDGRSAPCKNSGQDACCQKVIFILSPWRLVDYWDWTREPDLDAFELS